MSKSLASIGLITLGLLCTLGTLGSSLGMPLARADGKNMIEVGAGVQSNSFAKDTAVLLRVGYVRSGNLERGEYFVARLKGEAAFGTSSNGEALPYAQIEFTPYEHYQNKLQFKDLVQGLGGVVAHSTLGRELGVGQDTKLVVSVIGIRAGTVRLRDGDSGTGLFAQVAADFLGYRLVKFSEERADFTGMQIADVLVEAGAILSSGRDFTVRLSVGANADINQGGSFLVDSRLFAAVRVDIARFLRFFVQGSANLSRLSVKDADAIINTYTHAEAGIALFF